MRRMFVATVLLAVAVTASAAPLRVAVIDFEDQTGMTPDKMLGGEIAPGALAAKGVHLMGSKLVEDKDFVLIDRRDFVSQVEQSRPMDSGRPSAARPTFIQAAQALGADVVIRGSLLSFSPGKRVVDQGGHHSEHVTLAVRVGLQALDPVDGSVIAMSDGVASGSFRQTDSAYSVLSEEDVLRLMEKAIALALPELRNSLMERQAAAADRPRINLTVRTSADPAMVEIDGLLVGTTPLENLAVYQGDHVLTVGKPGYRDITKRIMFERDTTIEVPMIRTELTAEEMREILENARLNIMNFEPGLIIQHTE